MSLTAPASTDCPPSPRTDSDPHGIFSSLRTRNFRLFATGQLFSNTGTWVQRIAQDWLVLSLTGSATAVGITTALQFLPTLLFGLFGGLIADRYPKRAVLLVTQTALGLVAGVLAFLTLAHLVQAWQVYVVAFALGLVTAVDNPTRQAFANEMVGPAQLSNAISINSSVFQLGGLIGRPLAGHLSVRSGLVIHSSSTRSPSPRRWPRCCACARPSCAPSPGTAAVRASSGMGCVTPWPSPACAGRPSWPGSSACSPPIWP